MFTFYSYRITSCNMTNRPLFFRYKPAAPLDAEPNTLNDRKPMGNESIYTRFYSRNRSKPQSTIHQTAQCSISVAYVSFSGFLKMKAKPSISPKLTAKYEVGGL